MLAESVTAGEDPRNLVLVVVLVEANRTGDFHAVIFVVDCGVQLEGGFYVQVVI